MSVGRRPKGQGVDRALRSRQIWRYSEHIRGTDEQQPYLAVLEECDPGLRLLEHLGWRVETGAESGAQEEEEEEEPWLASWTLRKGAATAWLRINLGKWRKEYDRAREGGLVVKNSKPATVGDNGPYAAAAPPREDPGLAVVEGTHAAAVAADNIPPRVGSPVTVDDGGGDENDSGKAKDVDTSKRKTLDGVGMRAGGDIHGPKRTALGQPVSTEAIAVLPIRVSPGQPLDPNRETRLPTGSVLPGLWTPSHVPPQGRAMAIAEDGGAHSSYRGQALSMTEEERRGFLTWYKHVWKARDAEGHTIEGGEGARARRAASHWRRGS
ncbi:hypothetical protein ColLi_12204 [Colletotrichum liriopes]|uniref:Uncharacterized protein n=1 Tax=Colletotrichum liriopes TaxID=708192 RepID=A0AA37LZ98_9PEZI|nr:hypothetical protein ColLi_12204 [Colletotrichum liriopes]